MHIIRYEDIVLQPRPVLTELMKFILNVQTIEGTLIEKYIELACQERAPEIYKPRKGRVHANISKFRPTHLDYMQTYASELIDKFGYQDLFTVYETENAVGVPTVHYKHPNALESPLGSTGTLRELNQVSLDKSIYNLHESDEVLSIMVNEPALLLRKKNAIFPEGRTSYRFKHALRRHVTING